MSTARAPSRHRATTEGMGAGPRRRDSPRHPADRTDRRQLAGARSVPSESWSPSEVGRTLEGKKAHGRSERCFAGNGGASQRIRQWRKALKSTRSLMRCRSFGPATGKTRGTNACSACAAGVGRVRPIRSNDAAPAPAGTPAARLGERAECRQNGMMPAFGSERPIWHTAAGSPVCEISAARRTGHLGVRRSRRMTWGSTFG